MFWYGAPPGFFVSEQQVARILAAGRDSDDVRPGFASGEGRLGLRGWGCGVLGFKVSLGA